MVSGVIGGDHTMTSGPPPEFSVIQYAPTPSRRTAVLPTRFEDPAARQYVPNSIMYRLYGMIVNHAIGRDYRGQEEEILGRKRQQR